MGQTVFPAFSLIGGGKQWIAPTANAPAVGCALVDYGPHPTAPNTRLLDWSVKLDGVRGYKLTTKSANSGGKWGPMDGAAIMFLGDTAYLMGGWYGDIANTDWTGGSTTNLVYRSTDFGVTWNKIRDHNLTPDATHFTPRHTFAHCVHRVGSTDYMYLLCGDFDIADSDVRRSSDGVTWTKVNSVAPGYNGVSLAAAGSLGGNLYVVGGATALNAAGHKREVWRSTDNGVTWTSLGNAPWAIRSTVDRLVSFDGKLWLIGGGIYDDTLGRTYYNDVWSFDGTTWTQVLENGHSQWAGRMYANTFAFDGWLYVSRGSNASGNLAETHRSRDGKKWFKVAIELPASHADAVGVHSSGVMIGPGNGSLTNNVNTNSPTLLFESVGSDVASGVAAMIEASVPPPTNRFASIILDTFIYSSTSNQILAGEDSSGFYVCGGNVSSAKPVHIGSSGTPYTMIYGASIEPQGPINLPNYSAVGRNTKELFALSDNPAVRGTWHANAFRPYSFQFGSFCEYGWEPNYADAHLWNAYPGDNTYGGWRWLSGSGKTQRMHLHGDGYLEVGGNLKATRAGFGVDPNPSYSISTGGSVIVGGMLNVAGDGYYLGNVDVRGSDYVTRVFLNGNTGVATVAGGLSATTGSLIAVENNSYINFGGNNYLGGSTYFRNGAGTATGVAIDGALGEINAAGAVRSMISGYISQFKLIYGTASTEFLNNYPGSFDYAGWTWKNGTSPVATRMDLKGNGELNVYPSDVAKGITVQVAGANGNSGLKSGAWNGIGAIDWHSPAGVRHAFIGYNTDTALTVALEQGGPFRIENWTAGGGSYATPKYADIEFRTSQSSYFSGRIRTATMSANAPHSIMQLGVYANILSSPVDLVHLTGESGGQIVLGGTTPVSGAKVTIAGTLNVSGNSVIGGHITSQCQSLSVDPTTADIASGSFRTVKNITSGAVKTWLNDGGVMKASPAFV
jgi:hypothetical protein